MKQREKNLLRNIKERVRRVGAPAKWFLQRFGGEENNQGQAELVRWVLAGLVKSFLLDCFQIWVLAHYFSCSMHRPNALPTFLLPRPAPLGSQCDAPALSSWSFYTFRGSGRSAESFSAYSWIRGWKKKPLVCHRRPSCFCATAFTFLGKQKSRVTHTARGVSFPTHTLFIDPKYMAIPQRVSRGWFHPHRRRNSDHQRCLAMRCVAQKIIMTSPREVFKRRLNDYLLGILEKKFPV